MFLLGGHFLTKSVGSCGRSSPATFHCCRLIFTPRNNISRFFSSVKTYLAALCASVCVACNVISPVLVLHARHVSRRKALRLRRRRQRRPTSAILAPAPRASFLLACQEGVRRRRIPWAAVQAHQLAALIQHELLRSTSVACDAKPAVFVAKVVRHGGWRSAAVVGGKCFASHVVVDVGLRDATPGVRGASSIGVALTPRGHCCIEPAVVALPRFRFAAPFIKDIGPVTEARCFLAFVRSASSAWCRHRGALRRARGAVVSSQVLRLVDVPRAGCMDRRRLWIRPGSAGENGKQDGRSHGETAFALSRSPKK